MTGEQMFGAPVTGEAVIDHGPAFNIAGGQPRGRFVRRSDGKPLRVDDIPRKVETMSTALMVQDAPTVTTEQMALIQRTVAVGASPDELKLYLYDCARQGVHPLDKLIFFTKRKGKYTPITSIDFMRTRAADTGEYAGSDDATFAMLNVRENEAPVSASVTVWRLVQGTRCPFTATARWSEYKPNENDFMWQKMPHTMLAKCAEALALRKGFPRQLAGLYAKEEMDQANDEPKGYVVTAPGEHARPVIQQAAAPTLSSSVPNGGDSGRSDEGPDMGVDLPAGARRILKVGPGVAGAKAEITFNANVGDSGRSTLLTFKQSIADFAEQMAQTCEPVFPSLKQSASGNWRVEDLVGVPKTYNPETEPF